MKCTRKERVRYIDGRIRTVCGQPLHQVRRIREPGRIVHVLECLRRHELTVAVRR